MNEESTLDGDTTVVVAAPLSVPGESKVSLIADPKTNAVGYVSGQFHVAGKVSRSAMAALNRTDFSVSRSTIYETDEAAKALFAIVKTEQFLQSARRAEGGAQALSELIFRIPKSSPFAMINQSIVLAPTGPPHATVKFLRGTRASLDEIVLAFLTRYGQTNSTIRVTGDIDDAGKLVQMEYQGAESPLLAKLCEVARRSFVCVGYDWRATTNKDASDTLHLPEAWTKFAPPIVYSKNDASAEIRARTEDIITTWCLRHGIVVPPATRR